MVKIRFKRGGKKKHPFYSIVVTDVRKPRDSGFIQKIGVYNPMRKEEFTLQEDALKDWLSKGAEMSDSLKALLKRKQISL